MHLKLLDTYKGIASVVVLDGQSCLLWTDLWDGQVPCQDFPELFSFARNKAISISSAKSATSLGQLFHLPLSSQAFAQVQVLLTALDHQANATEHDIWVYIWGSAMFSSSKTYKHLTGSSVIHPAFTWLWKSRSQPKHKVFFWFLLKDRLSTRELLRRKTMILQSYNCVLCQKDTEETLQHLFIHCPFAQASWQILELQVTAADGPFENLEAFKMQLGVTFFMEVIITMCCCIWMMRMISFFEI